MSHTPEIKSSPFQKFSPFGVGISKTLLTPCRRVGLSRKRGSQTTPISIMKTPTESSKNLLNENSSKTTPVDYERSISNGRHPHSSSKNMRLGKTKFSDDESIKNSSCKKVLAQNFSSGSIGQTSALIDEMGDLGVLTIAKNTIDLEIDKEKEQGNLTMRDENNDKRKPRNSQNNTKESSLEPVATVSLENTQDVEIEGKENSNNSCEESDSNLEEEKKEKPVKSKKTTKSREKLPQKKTVKSTTVYDSDDDFIPLDTKSSRKKRTSTADNTLRKISKSASLKDCNVSLERLESKKLIKAKSLITSDNDNLSDNEFVVVKKKKLFVIDDNDSINSSPKHVASKVVSNSHEDDDDTAFTSTPDQEKSEKKKLIHMITDLEKSIVEKKKKLEDLKQASIYKKKHNIEELDTLTKIWKSGCESGLKSLLRQLQAHGPMDMATLLEKLHIPQDVVAQLSLSDSFA